MSTRKKPSRRNYNRKLAAVTNPGSPAPICAACEFNRKLGITILDAKWIDPQCWKGCQSLIHKNRIEKLEAAIWTRIETEERLLQLAKQDDYREDVSYHRGFKNALLWLVSDLEDKWLNAPKDEPPVRVQPAGFAALTEYIERKKREARRKWPDRLSGPTGRELASYWEGQYVALVNLQRRIERIVKVPPGNTKGLQ